MENNSEKNNENKEKQKLTKKQKRLIVILVLALLLIAAAVYTVAIRPKLQQEKVYYDPVAVLRGTVNVTVNESGAIEYEQSSVKYDLDLDVSDDDDDDDDDDEEETTVKYLVIDKVYKASGQIVNAGDELLKFSDTSIESVRKLLAAAVADAQVEYNDAKSEYELNCLEAELDYKTQLINAGYAKKLYSQSASQVSDNISAIQAEIENRQSKVAGLEEDIAEAQEDYDEAAEDYAEAKKLVDGVSAADVNLTNYVTYERIYQNAQTSYNNALTALERAQDALTDNADQIAKLQQQLSSAKASAALNSISVKQEYLETVQSGDNAYLVYKASLESLQEDLKEAEDTLEKREEQLRAFEELVGTDGIVRATQEGMLVSVNVEEGEKLTEEKTMISYATSDALTISVDVTEEDVVSLTVGDPVSIVFTAYPEEEYIGVIKSIDTTATSSNTNTVSYPVVLKLEGDLTKMYGGMTANVCFEIESSADALYISRKALVEDGGSYYVYVKSGMGDYELQKVEIGLKNTSYAEIVSGLEENDTVYIRTTGV